MIIAFKPSFRGATGDAPKDSIPLEGKVPLGDEESAIAHSEADSSLALGMTLHQLL
jgi:hypothetical protein